jgi:hypothetical protein
MPRNAVLKINKKQDSLKLFYPDFFKGRKNSFSPSQNLLRGRRKKLKKEEKGIRTKDKG